MKWTFLFFMLLLLSGNACCQIEGDVRDNANNRIKNAMIIAIDSTASSVDTVVSDESGFYEFKNLKPGKYFIAAKAFGFETRQYKNVVARARANKPGAGRDITNSTRLQIVLFPAKDQKQ